MNSIIVDLNLPFYEFKIKEEDRRFFIYDEIRKNYFLLTPEEWVRQNFIKFLINELGYPKLRIAVEMTLGIGSDKKRCDAVVFDKQLKPQVIVECKKPDIKISQKTFDQIGRYNIYLKVKYLIVTNGLDHYFCEIDFKRASFSFKKEMPEYKSLL
jgi:hypothetical protein